MPIPSQNDFLLPFLHLLSDGSALTRARHHAVVIGALPDPQQVVEHQE